VFNTVSRGSQMTGVVLKEWSAAGRHVGQSEANGYTLLASPPPPLAINQFLFKSLTFKPSDFAIPPF
jgi:hypothetical protein